VSLYIDVLNRVVANRPADLTIGMHLCRGNMEGLWMGDGGYAPIADALFNRADVDAFLLEYDSARAGDFAPLRYLPAGKRAYLGIISTKNPEIESVDALLRRIEDASKYAPMDRLGICPQCGFSSAAMSKFAILPSKVTTDIQSLKIERLVEAGQRAWGHV
jgi:5-methyltetrahydropteroyltriglutamate--homocysteine methyltransferase